MKKENFRYIILIIAIVLIVIIEQVLKIYIMDNYKEIGSISLIENAINITYVENTGGAFGIGQNDLFTFILVNAMVIGIIVRFIITQKDRIGVATLVALTLILGGGISNLLDRIFRGYVVDYIDISPIFKFPVFNLADLLIIVGWIWFVALISVSTIKLKNEKVDGKIEENNSK
ncbi:MAG: signal peptidase II [Clostridia bacterium]|nr:signal peptidase II [Clostridia bacterium]